MKHPFSRRFTALLSIAVAICSVAFSAHAFAAPAAPHTAEPQWPLYMGMALSADAALKLDTIMRTGFRALKRRLSPILALSTVFRDQALTETDTIQVPFYSLETMASTDFDGCYDFGDGNVATRPVTINKRKYQGLEFTSKELRRNSAVNLGMILQLKIEKLAEDVLTDIFSVVTAANFPGTPIYTGSAAAFDRSDVSDMRTLLNKAMWPQASRSLILESDYEGALTKDIMQVNTHEMGDDVRREGSVGRLGGFDIFEHPGMPTNGENLVGAALLPYAILVAFSPIQPAEEVRANMSDYRKYTDGSGLTLEYRAWGDPNCDSAKRTIEVNYGYAKGDSAQLRRLTSA